MKVTCPQARCVRRDISLRRSGCQGSKDRVGSGHRSVCPTSPTKAKVTATHGQVNSYSSKCHDESTTQQRNAYSTRPTDFPNKRTNEGQRNFVKVNHITTQQCSTTQHIAQCNERISRLVDTKCTRPHFRPNDQPNDRPNKVSVLKEEGRKSQSPPNAIKVE